MFEISEDICKKIIEECEMYKFHDFNNLSNYEIFEKVLYFDERDRLTKLLTIKR